MYYDRPTRKKVQTFFIVIGCSPNRAVGQSETPAGVEPARSCFAGSRLTVWLQRQVVQCPRQESSLVFDLRGVACKSPTLRGHSFQRPAEESNLVRQFRGLPCSSGTPARRCGQVARPGIEPGLTASEAVVRSGTPTGQMSVSRPGVEPGGHRRAAVVGFRKALCDPLHHGDVLSGPTTGFAPASCGLQDRRLSQSSHVGNSSRSARI